MKDLSHDQKRASSFFLTMQVDLHTVISSILKM